MAEKYTNKNTKITNEQVIFITNQFKIIDEQIGILRSGKKELLEKFDVTNAMLHLRRTHLFKEGITKEY